jgi:hypothetical protein
MRKSSDALRRWLGSFCLAMAFGMLVWGQTVLSPHLKGVPFLIYWLFCFLFTVGAMIAALLDLRATRQRSRDEQRELLEQALKEIETAKKDRTAQKDR